MKDFFKTMFASALGVLVAIGVCIIAFIAVVVSMIAHVNQVSDYHPKANTILKIHHIHPSQYHYIPPHPYNR